MSIPSVVGFMPLSVTPRSLVCDEQGVGEWPMWKRYNNVKAIIDQYVDEPYRDFLALPYYEVDKLKGEELFYWYTPRSNMAFLPLNRTGDDYEYYKGLLAQTLAHYQSVIDKLKGEGKAEEASFLQMSLKYAGDQENNVFCGDGRVVATVWGMRPRPGHELGDSMLISELFPPKEMHTVQYNIGAHGTTEGVTTLKKGHGTVIYSHQVPQVTASSGYEFTGWDRDPEGTKVDGDLVFTAQYREIPKPEKLTPPESDPPEELPQMHHVRFLTPDGTLIKELEVEHGKKILPGYVPQLPVVNGVLCSAWDGNPLNDVIEADHDYKAIAPEVPEPEKELHTVRFLTPDKEVLSQFQVEHGTQLASNQVPALPVVDGETCPGWDKDPLKEKINADTDFVAKTPSKKRGDFWTALLKWLLLALGLLLLFLLLWCFIFDKCHLNLCGCDCGCNETIVVKPDPDPDPDPGPDPDPEPIPEPVLKPCDALQKNGSNNPESFLYEMGQQKGTFLFEYETGGVHPDKIVVYDGDNTNEKILFEYYGTTGSYSSDRMQKNITFSNWKVLIVVSPSQNPDTYWEIKANCPNN